MLKYSQFISESSSTSSIKKLKFNIDGVYTEIVGTYREILRKLSDFCYEKGFKFSNVFDENEVINKIKSKSFTKSSFHKLPSGKYIGGFDHANSDGILRISKKWLSVIGKLDNLSIGDFDIKDSDSKKNLETSKVKVNNIETNPFKQSICVLGESGSGKSTTIENILENEDHIYEFIIPSASTTGLLSQFSPSKNGYVKSKLGKMILEAANDPKRLYTAVFDEFHKSNVIEMINDELLQCISTKRNNGKRFISLDDDTAELYSGVPELEPGRNGNIHITDNLGFIFISSKRRVIVNNSDFFNRVDIIILKSYEEEEITTSEELLSKVLSPSEKSELISHRND